MGRGGISAIHATPHASTVDIEVSVYSQPSIQCDSLEDAQLLLSGKKVGLDDGPVQCVVHIAAGRARVFVDYAFRGRARCGGAFFVDVPCLRVQGATVFSQTSQNSVDRVHLMVAGRARVVSRPLPVC